MEFIEIRWRSRRYDDEIDLRNRLLRAPLGLDFSEEALREEEDHLHFGLVDRDTLLCCAVVVPLTETTAKLRQMVVDDSQQRRGLGTQLVQEIETVLVDRGFQSVELNARTTAVGFYQRLGYVIEGEEFIEVSIPHRKMIKSIVSG